jgi:hypothetical protein
VKRRTVRGKLRLALLALHSDRLGPLDVHRATVTASPTERQSGPLQTPRSSADRRGAAGHSVLVPETP